jgi:hydroxyquinol 1,2-dioxygenase
MIIERQEQVTNAVLNELDRAKSKDPRFVEIMSAAVRHLHAFVREVGLSEDEFHQVANQIARLGLHTNATHNEVVLACGSLGVSTLVCLLNNGNKGQTETTANLLGPFWRANAPRERNGASIVRSPTPGPGLVVRAQVKDASGMPVAGALVDVWQSSPQGFYENQDPTQADMNLRGVFTTDKDGRFSFRSVKPAGYPIPVNGPVGDLLRIQGRANMRPAHLHFLIHKEGLKTHISQVYVNDDDNLETDCQFGVTRTLVGNFVKHEDDGEDMAAPWYSLDYTFIVEPGDSKVPRPPITGKSSHLEVLEVLKRA